MVLSGKTRREVLTEFRHAEILTAARKVFAEHGFTASTLDQIAAEAGIAKGTIYLYFSSKDEILWAAIRSRINAMIEQASVEMGKVSTAREKLRTWLRVRFSALREDEDFLRVYYSEFGQMCRLKGMFRQEFRELYQRGAAILMVALEEGIRSGELRPLPTQEIALALMNLSRDMFAEQLLDMYSSTVDQEQFIFDLFWSGIAGQPGNTGADPVESQS